jgi:flagellar hook-associated protein 2
MAGITSSVGIGSGIDINSTVNQLTAAEGKPQLDAIASKTSISQTKLSGLGTLKSALSTFQSAVNAINTASAFQSQKITSSEEKVLKVSTDSSATAASHVIKVNALSAPQRSVSNVEFKSTDVVSEGVFVFNDNTGSPKFMVNISKGVNDSLTGLRDAINNAKGNNSVIASIINVDSKSAPGTTVSRLVLMSKTPGTANAFTVDGSSADTRFTLNETSSIANYTTTQATDTNIIIDPQPVSATPQRSVANSEFTNTDVVATGLIAFKNATGTEKFSVNIVKGVNDKIFAAMDAINNAPGNDSVVASVINVPSKINPGTSVSKLVFTSKQTGVDGKFSIDASQGDTRFTLDATAVNAQKSVSVTEFAANDKVAPGILSFKDVAGNVVFSVTTTADNTLTLDANGNKIPTDADGNLIIPTDENGNPVATTTQTVNGENNTLEQLKNAINYNPENKKLVVASIVQSDSTTTPGTLVSKLVLTALNPGLDKGFTIDASAGDTRLGLDPIKAPNNFITTTTVSNFETTDAANASDGGQSVTRSSNTISDAIPGVTLNLLTTGTSNIEVSADSSIVSKKISSLADAYNSLNDILKQLTNYVGPGDRSNGPLLGDSTVQTVISQIKSIMNGNVSTATGSYKSLNDLGFSFDKKGVMSVDITKLQNVLSSDLTSVANVFSSSNGISTQLNSKLTQYLDAKGPISTEQETLNKTLTDLTKQKASVEARLESTRKTLQAQFVAMDQAVAQFKNTGTFLTQSLTKSNSNSNN